VVAVPYSTAHRLTDHRPLTRHRPAFLVSIPPSSAWCRREIVPRSCQTALHSAQPALPRSSLRGRMPGYTDPREFGRRFGHRGLFGKGSYQASGPTPIQRTNHLPREYTFSFRPPVRPRLARSARTRAACPDSRYDPFPAGPAPTHRAPAARGDRASKRPNFRVSPRSHTASDHAVLPCLHSLALAHASFHLARRPPRDHRGRRPRRCRRSRLTPGRRRFRGVPALLAPAPQVRCRHDPD
jgi:hypothetical protein